MPAIRFLSSPPPGEAGFPSFPPKGSKPVTKAFMSSPSQNDKGRPMGAPDVSRSSSRRLLVGRVDGPAGHDVDQVSAILGAGVNVAVQPVSRDLDVLDGVR